MATFNHHAHITFVEEHNYMPLIGENKLREVIREVASRLSDPSSLRAKVEPLRGGYSGTIVLALQFWYHSVAKKIDSKFSYVMRWHHGADALDNATREKENYDELRRQQFSDMPSFVGKWSFKRGKGATRDESPSDIAVTVYDHLGFVGAAEMMNLDQYVETALNDKEASGIPNRVGLFVQNIARKYNRVRSIRSESPSYLSGLFDYPPELLLVDSNPSKVNWTGSTFQFGRSKSADAQIEGPIPIRRFASFAATELSNSDGPTTRNSAGASTKLKPRFVRPRIGLSTTSQPTDSSWIIGFSDVSNHELWVYTSNNSVVGEARKRLETEVTVEYWRESRGLRTAVDKLRTMQYPDLAQLYPQELDMMLSNVSDDAGTTKKISLALRHSDLHCGNIMSSESHTWLIDIGDALDNLLWADSARLEVSLWCRLAHKLRPSDVKLIPQVLEAIERAGMDAIPKATLKRASAELRLLCDLSQAIRRHTQIALAEHLCTTNERILAYALSSIVEQRYDLLTATFDEEVQPARAARNDRDLTVKAALCKYWTGMARRQMIYVAPQLIPSKSNKRTSKRPEDEKWTVSLSPFTVDQQQSFHELLPTKEVEDGLPLTLHELRQLLTGREVRHATSKVAVIHGSSGSGKSSLVNAALIPKLRNDDKLIVMSLDAVEDTRIGDEITQVLRRKLANFDGFSAKPNVPLEGLISEVNIWQRQCEQPRKIIVFVDQFEQWLHSLTEDPKKSALGKAIEASDGDLMQWVVIVREEFMPQIYAFMKAVGVPREENVSTFYVHALPRTDAENVLKKLCQKVQQKEKRPFNGNEEFIRRVVSDLAEEGFVRPVRLTVFALTHSNLAWDQNWLGQLTGNRSDAQWVPNMGLRFLDNTFTDAKYQGYKPNALRVLDSLRRGDGNVISGSAAIKSGRKSYSDLKGATSYPNDAEFDRLIDVLDSKLKLIRPIIDEDNQREQSYELAHDYLVEAVKLWSREEKEKDKDGKIEVLLEDSHENYVRSLSTKRPLLPKIDDWRSLYKFACDHANDPLVDQSKDMMQACNDAYLKDEYDDLLKFESTDLPKKLDEILYYRDALVARFSNELLEQVESPTSSKGSAKRQLHALLLLLGKGSSRREDAAIWKALVERIKVAHPSELPVIYGELSGHQPLSMFLANHMRVAIGTPGADFRTSRLRAASSLFFLSAHKSSNSENDPGLGHIAQKFVKDLIEDSEGRLAEWIVALNLLSGLNQKIGDTIQELIWEAAYIELQDANNSMTERSRAAQILADYAANTPEKLAEALMAAEIEHFPLLFQELTKDRHYEQEDLARAEAVLQKQIEKPRRSLAIKYGPNEEARSFEPEQEAARLEAKKKATDELTEIEVQTKRTANAVVSLVRMGHTKILREFLIQGPDPSLRSYVIHRLAPLGVDFDRISTMLPENLASTNNLGAADLSICRALILSLAEFDVSQMSEEVNKTRKQLVQQLLKQLNSVSDAALHSAVEWVLRKFQEQLPAEGIGPTIDQVEEQFAQAREHRTEIIPMSYRNKLKQKMIAIPKNEEFVIGVPWYEDFWKDSGRVPRPIHCDIAIGARLVTWCDYYQFVDEFAKVFEKEFEKELADGLKLERPYRNDELTGLKVHDAPATSINWHEAALYCNWLNRKDGISKDKAQDIFDITFIKQEDKSNQEDKIYKVQANVVKDYFCKSGYRMPTEAEMEYATRAGSVTSRYYGDSLELLEYYAWYQSNSKNRTPAVGTLKPNDWGLFDSLGLCYTWCLEEVRDDDYKPPIEGIHENIDLNGTKERAVRGGCYFDPPTDVRSGYRYKQAPDNHKPFIGLRVVRRLPDQL